MKKVSILIPCYNEEGSLPLLYEALCVLMDGQPEYEWEVLLINDGSRDGTLGLMRELHQRDSRVSYLDLSRNYGKERAMLAGFDYVSGDCAVIMDADLQHPPTLVPQMLLEWENGYEDIYARRNSRGQESWLRKRLSLAYYWLLQRSTKFDILQNVGDFRLLDRRCISALCRLRESERYTKGMFCWIGFHKKEILFDQQERVAGKSSWNFFKLLDLAIDGITSFTTAPLRISTFLGFLMALSSFCYIIWFMVKKIVWGDPVQVFTTIITVMLLLGGIQLLSIGLIGEYLGRVFNETKNRPVYIAREYNGKLV